MHFAGGRFLVYRTALGRDTLARFGEHGFWSDRPEEVFEPEQRIGLRPYDGIIDGGFGFQFASLDGGTEATATTGTGCCGRATGPASAAANCR